MSFTLEKVTEEFVTLTTQEKVNFLKRIVVTPPGEWVELNNKLYFIPEGPSATEEEREILENANKEIDNGQGISLNELKKKLKV